MDSITEKIYKASLKLLEPLSDEETYSLIAQEGIKLINGEDGRILLEEDGEWKAVYNSSDAIAKIQTRKKGHSYTAFKKKRAFVVTRADSLAAHPELESTKVRAIIFIPLSYRNKSIGVLLVRSHENQDFTEKELEILKLYGSMASLAIRKAQLYSETKQALDTRDLFISLAAHELRTPLTAVSGYVQLLQNKLATLNQPESRWAEQAVWECRRLTGLVNELLEINKVNSGKLQYNFSTCSLKEISQRAQTAFSFSHPNQQLVVEDKLTKGDLIIGDFDKLLQVLTNLLDNAAKFSDQNEQGVVFKLGENKTNYIIQVKDHGVGIPSKDLPKVFNGFFKGHESKSGMGLGLYLAKAIIDHHHGDISVKSKLNYGTTMQIRLPKVNL